MERLTIDKVIEHCERNVDRHEKTMSRECFETKDMDSWFMKEYWEHRQVAKWLKELKQYKEAEEQGLLLKLPCKVGDKVWWLNGKFLMECEIVTFAVDEDGVSFAHIRYLYEKEHNRYYGHNLDIEKLGITWFLTKEEAEQALAGMKEV